mgnify:CR=1 FL=1
MSTGSLAAPRAGAALSRPRMALWILAGALVGLSIVFPLGGDAREFPLPPLLLALDLDAAAPRSTLTEGRDFGVLSVKSWRLADLGAKHALLLAGLGWGNMPKPMINEDLKRGRLVALKVETPVELTYPFHTVYRSDTPPGP